MEGHHLVPPRTKRWTACLLVAAERASIRSPPDSPPLLLREDAVHHLIAYSSPATGPVMAWYPGLP